MALSTAEVRSISDKPWLHLLPPGITEDPSLLRQAEVQHITLAAPGRPLSLIIGLETEPAPIDGRRNEDSLMSLPMGEGRHLVAVLDGASSQRPISGLTENGMSGAFYVSHLLSSGFSASSQYRELCQRPELSAGDVMRTANSWLHGQMFDIPGVDYQDVLYIPGMAASFCLIDAPKHRISLAHVADTVVVSSNTDGKIKVLTPNQNARFDKETLDFRRQLALKYHCSLSDLRNIPEAKAEVAAHMADSFRKKTNVPDGCGILNGMPQLESNHLIYEASFPVSPKLDRIFLLSDGAILPYMQGGVVTGTALSRLASEARTRTVGSHFLQFGMANLLEDPVLQSVLPQKKADDSTIIEVQFPSHGH